MLNREDTVRLVTIVIILMIAFPAIFFSLLGSLLQGIMIGAGVAIIVALLIVLSKSYHWTLNHMKSFLILPTSLWTFIFQFNQRHQRILRLFFISKFKTIYVTRFNHSGIIIHRHKNISSINIIQLLFNLVFFGRK